MTCDIRYDSPMMTELATFPPLWPGRAHLRTLADLLGGEVMPSVFPAVSPRMPREVDAGGLVCWGAQMKTAPEGAGNTDEGLPNPKQPERTTPMVDDQTSLYRYFDREGALIYVGVTSRGATRNVEHNTRVSV